MASALAGPRARSGSATRGARVAGRIAPADRAARHAPAARASRHAHSAGGPASADARARSALPVVAM